MNRANAPDRPKDVASPSAHAARIVAKQRIMPVSYRRAFTRGGVRDEEWFLAKIAERFGSSTQAIPVGRARAGIYLLAAQAVRDGRRKVLMSPFTIPDVVTMVVLAGAEPVFYDFEPNSTACSLSSLQSLLDGTTACVLVTHYHVNETRLPEIAELCRRHGAYLFDDCAISFGGTIDGRPIGTLTDASVFSFSSFKLLNYFWGGLVTTRDPTIANSIAAAVGEWPRLGGRDYMTPAKACLKYDLASSPPLFGSLVFPLIKSRMKKSAAAKGLEHIRIETAELDPTLTSRPALAAFAEWTPKLDKVDGWLVQRRQIARIYARKLGSRMVGADTPAAIIDGSCFTNFPVLVPQERCGEIARSMILAGYDVGRSLYPNAHRHPKFMTVAGGTDNLDRMVASTVYLPTHFGVSECYAEALASRLADEINS